MKTAAILLADGFEEVEAITPIDFLRRAGIDVTIIGVTGGDGTDGDVTGGHGIQVRTDVPVTRADELKLDAVIIPGGMPGAENIAASEEAKRLILRVFTEGGLVAAICAAPAVVLDPLGVLKDKQATCYPGFETRFKHARYSRERIVRDGTVISSCGPGCAADFSLAIIEYLIDKDTANEVRWRTLND